jgi:hypothetical protein
LSPILGIIASQNYTRITGSYESIATVTVGAGGATASFTSIPQTYKHLQLRFIARDTYNSGGGQTDSNMYMKFNGSSSSYRNHSVYGTGSSAGAGTSTDPIAGRITGLNSTSGVFGVGVVDILDYTSTSKNKTVRSLSGHDQNGSGLIFLFSELWYATPAAITQIDLTTGNGTNFAQYSHFALYGIRD